ncbi:MAG: phage head closure protein [Streptococcus sp.]|nr:phage head closure protein [Streptococcus sp.]
MPIIKNINELNDRITIIKVEPRSGPDPSGETETELFSCWAKIRTQNIKDVEVNMGTAFEDTTQIVIRQIQKQAITNKMRVKWKDKTYNIVKVNPDTAFKEYMVLVVKSVN